MKEMKTEQRSKTIKKLFASVVFTVYSLLLTAVCCLKADYDDLGAGSRAIGMGNSFTALADDAFGLYYNPAGLGLIRTAQVGVDFGRMHFGLDDNSNIISGFNAVVYPMLKMRVSEPGVYISSSATPNDAFQSTDVSSASASNTRYDNLGTIAFGWKYFILSDHYQESTYYLGFGMPVSNRWAWGLNLKYLYEKYNIDDYLRLSPVFDYGRKSSVENISIDAGVIYNLLPRLFVGASIIDINQPNTGLMVEDNVPCTGRVGVAWKEKGLCWAVDGIYRRNQWYYSAGFEKYVMNVLGLRTGINFGGREYLNVSGGFSISFFRAQIDYVFQYPLSGLKDIAGTHRMSLVFRFGRRERSEMEIGSIEYYYAKLHDQLGDVSQRLLETKTEKENLEKILIEESTMRMQERIKVAKAEAKASVRTATAPKTSSESKEIKEIRHTVQVGETLQSIAEKYYGSSKYWDVIYQMNKENIGRGGVLKPNQTLVIPALVQGGAEPVVSVQKSDMPKVIAAPEVKTLQETKPELIKDTPIKVEIPAQKDAEKVQPTPADRIVPVKVSVPGADVPPISKKAPSFDKNIGDSLFKKKIEIPKGELLKTKSLLKRKHIVQQGENLRIIAQKYYDDSSRWKEIYQANKDKVTSGQVTPGQELVIP